MHAVIIVVAAVVVVVVLFFWLGLNRPGQEPQPCRQRLVPDRRPAQASPRPDPQPRETVKGYAAHESGTLERSPMPAPRDQCAGSRATGAAENALSGALKTLFAVSEAYPDLKANQNFLALQRSSPRRGSHRVRPAVLQRQRSPTTPRSRSSRRCCWPYVQLREARLLRRRSEDTARCRCSSRRASGPRSAAHAAGPSPSNHCNPSETTGPQTGRFPCTSRSRATNGAPS